MAFDKTEPSDGLDCASVDDNIRANFAAIESALGAGTLANGMTVVIGNILQGLASGRIGVLAPGTAGQFLKCGGAGVINSWATVISSIKDYGTSASTGTTKSIADLKMCYGQLTVTDSQAVTNLPFTSSSSYVVLTSMDSTYDEVPQIAYNSGSQFTITESVAGAPVISWLAIGT